MNLLRKYYDGLADLPSGGGIPDEDIIRNHVKAYYYHKDRQLNDDDILPVKRVRAIVNEIKQTHYKEISRLKEENERLRGEVDRINARFEENMVRFYYFMNKHFIPIKESEYKYPVNFIRHGQYNGRMAQSTIEEIVKEYFESINPSQKSKQ